MAMRSWVAVMSGVRRVEGERAWRMSAVARVMRRVQKVIQRRAPAMWPGWGRPIKARKSQEARRSMGAAMVLVRAMTVQKAMMGTAVRIP